jgi:hypothetical protein
MANYKVSTDITKETVTRAYRQYTTDNDSNNRNYINSIKHWFYY